MSLIKIKRSAVTAIPVSLLEGEPAYSELSGNLYIGTNGGADIQKIGGKTDVDKLATIEAGAEVNNISDANATDLTDGGASTLHYHTADRARGNHTGTQLASTISDFAAAVTAAETSHADVLVDADKGAPNGVAPLDGSSLIPTQYLPAFVDDVLEFANLAGFPATGETGKIYVALDTNKTYRWSGTVYIYITSGAVDSVAGKTGVVTLVKGDVGLGNVDNTSDLAKPISTATQTALDGKVDDAQVLTNVPAGAVFTDTVYTHPTTAGNKHIPAGGVAGQFLKWSADGTAVWAADNDTIYTHPTTAGNKHIPTGGAAGNFLIWSASGTAVWTDTLDGGSF